MQESRALLDGERKDVAVIFADISGFTSMSEELDPEEVRDLMNNCFKGLVDIIYKYEGYVDKFIGDCIMALFGAPIAHENDPERAVRCSLELLEELERFNGRRQLASPLGLSIGINYGIVVTGTVGTAMRKEYTVMGDTVNIAQRLQGLAERNQILVGEKIYQATEGLFEYETREPVKVKGKKLPIQCYLALGERKGQARPSPLSTLVSDFQGRKPEFLGAEQAIHKVAKSRGQVIVVSGESGIGKSRFTEELIDTIKASPYKWQVLRGACVSHSSNLSYFIFLGILRELVQIEDNDSEDDLRLKLSKLKGYNLNDNEVHILANMFAIKFAESNIQYFNEEAKKNLTFQAIKTLFLNLSRTNHLLLYLDDCQWLDPLSEELLGFLFESIENEKILILYTTRIKETLGLVPRQCSAHFPLLPLSRGDTNAMVHSILKDCELSQPVLDLIWSKSGGNPLFVEEIIKSMVEAGSIVRTTEGGFQVLEQGLEVDIPPTIQGLLAARIDKLPDELKWVLQVFSVVGLNFSHLLLSRIFNHDEYLEASIQALLKRDMICIVKEGLDERDREYGFRSTLLREVAYKSILKRKLKEIHQEVAKIMEELFHDRIDEHVEHLAYHYLETDFLDKKTQYCERSGDKLANEHQLQGSNDYYERCLALINENLENMPLTTRVVFLDRSNIKEKVVQLNLKIIKNCNKLGAIERGLTLVEKTLELLPDSRNTVEHVLGWYWKGKFQYDRGEYDKARESLILALRLAVVTSSKPDIIIEVRCFLGATYERLGDSGRSLNELNEAMKLAEGHGDKHLLGELSLRYGTTALFKGDYKQALEYYHKALEATADGMLKHFKMKALGNIGIVYGFQKKFKKALEYYQLALELAMEIGDKIGIARNLHNMGELFYEMNDLEQAYSHFEKSLPLSEEIGWKEGYVTNLLYVGYLSYTLLEEQKGIAELERGIAEADRLQFKRTIPQGKFLLAKLYCEDGEFEKAREVIAEGLEVSERTGFQKLVDEFRKLETKLNQLERPT